MSQKMTTPNSVEHPPGWAELFYEMVECSALAQFYVDSADVVRYLNRKGHEVFRQLEPDLGFGPEQLVNAPVRRLAEIIPELRTAMVGSATGTHSQYSCLGKHWLKWNVARMIGTDDRPAGSAITLEMITDQKELVAGLQREVQRLTKGLTATVLPNASGMVAEVGSDAELTLKSWQHCRDITEQIREGVQSVTRIAQQTNLLSLNAALAAAKAGDASAQFNDVVQGIRDLARRTAMTAQDLSHLVRLLQDSTQNTAGGLANLDVRLDRINSLTTEIARGMSSVDPSAE